MKRVIILVLAALLLFTFSGCEEKQTESRPDVVINMPVDDSVNGYRVSRPESSSSEKAESTDESLPTETKYCANINSKVFHKITCSSVPKMKEENKAFFLNRSILIDEGYTPCQRCKP